MNKIIETGKTAIDLPVRYNQPDERLFAEIVSAQADTIRHSQAFDPNSAQSRHIHYKTK
jgi:hypothetical protein